MHRGGSAESDAAAAGGWYALLSLAGLMWVWLQLSHAQSVIVDSATSTSYHCQVFGCSDMKAARFRVISQVKLFNVPWNVSHQLVFVLQYSLHQLNMLVTLPHETDDCTAPAT